MKRYAAVAAVVLTAALAAPSAQAADLLTRPARDDARVISTAGTYTQEQADANRAAYVQLQDYTDQQAQLDAGIADGLRANMLALVDDIGAKNAQIELMGQQIYGLRSQVTALEATVATREAKIRHLRKVIRALRAAQ
jgi:hypothetical protein